MSDQFERLLAELSQIEVTSEVQRALGELCYTASETGIIPFALRGDDLNRFVQLVKLAEKYGESLPNSLKM